VLQQIRRHARGSMGAEICGVLIGDVVDDVTRVGACIAGEEARECGANVTFTQQTWQHIYKVKDAKFAESSIVGWYHSHPGFGIFLSDYDLFIHKNFFEAPHQVAWVFDPHSDEEGCFGWIAGKIAPLKRFSIIRESTETYKDGQQSVNDVRAINSIGLASSREGDWKRRLLTLRKWATCIFIVFVFVVGLCLGFRLSKARHKGAKPPEQQSKHETHDGH
jgi:proteasome lid subunit RPN8/RPN11